jgi:SPP1 family predicted phage head-tail adaptor
MNKRFNNKSNYDPGRFRFTLNFYQEVTTISADGSQVVTLTPLLTTHAVQEPFRDGSQIAINAGASTLNQDCYFVIRNRSTFYPEKDMIVTNGNNGYVINAVIPLDVPVNYIKLLCVRRDVQVTT